MRGVSSPALLPFRAGRPLCTREHVWKAGMRLTEQGSLAAGLMKRASAAQRSGNTTAGFLGASVTRGSSAAGVHATTFTQHSAAPNILRNAHTPHSSTPRSSGPCLPARMPCLFRQVRHLARTDTHCKPHRSCLPQLHVLAGGDALLVQVGAVSGAGVVQESSAIPSAELHHGVQPAAMHTTTMFSSSTLVDASRHSVAQHSDTAGRSNGSAAHRSRPPRKRGVVQHDVVVGCGRPQQGKHSRASTAPAHREEEGWSRTMSLLGARPRV